MKFRLQPFRSASAFTMVEIALCLAIVGFALVAIIGVLPAGLNVQKENREDTILNQDSTVWLDAIRSGARGYDDLTNYVDRIVVSNYLFDLSGQPAGVSVTLGVRSDGISLLPVDYSGPAPFELVNGEVIIGLLSTPRFLRTASGFSSNYVYAYVRAISGTATEKPAQENPEVRAGAFGYRMVVEVVPSGAYDSYQANILTSHSDAVARQNLYDVRILCRWPLKKPFASNLALDEPMVGNSGRMTFRTQASGRLDFSRAPFYFIRPGEYEFRP